MKTVVICSSGSFYRHCNEIADQLRQKGYKVVVPATAQKMRLSGDYDITKVKTWVDNPVNFRFKEQLAISHFNEIAKGDAILIINDDKPNQPHYIGPNTTMEWGLAYYLKKPVYIWKGVPKDSNYYEEVYSMATVIDGDINKIDL